MVKRWYLEVYYEPSVWSTFLLLHNQKFHFRLLLRWCGLTGRPSRPFLFPLRSYSGFAESHFRNIFFPFIWQSSAPLLSQAFITSSVGEISVLQQSVFISFLLTCDGRHSLGVFLACFDFHFLLAALLLSDMLLLILPR